MCQEGFLTPDGGGKQPYVEGVVGDVRKTKNGPTTRYFRSAVAPEVEEIRRYHRERKMLVFHEESKSVLLIYWF